MQVFGQGGQIGSQWRPRGTETKRRRAGWWFWYPFLFGLFFTLGAVAFILGSVALGGTGASGGLTITAVVWLLIGLGSLAVAWYAHRDIASADPPPQVPGEPSDSLEQELRTTGVPGHAMVKGVKYLAGSTFEGTTLVQLTLDVTTTLGGTVPLVEQVRVPMSVTERLGAGATVPVRISSTDPSKMMVEWTGLVPATPAAPPAAAT